LFVIRHLSLAALLVAVLFAPARLAAQSSPYTPYQHKALYLFNFAKFTEWPREVFASDDAPFVIGILGNDPFGKDIEIIKGKTIKGRKLEIRYCDTPEKVAGCQMLFINSSETNLLAEAMAVIGRSSILIIAETDEFIQQHVMIKLVGEQKSSGAMTVGFEINLPAAERASLKLDTQLLKLAKRVKNQTG
jgi:hypothetical protein